MIEHPVIVMGVAGCGKSSLGQALAAGTGALLIEGDAYHSDANRAKMRSGIPLNDDDRAGWLDALAAELRRRGPNVVLTCSALKRAYRDRLRAAGPVLRFVFMEIDPVSARARIEARDAFFFSPPRVASQFQALESPVHEPGVLRVDALVPLPHLVAEVTTWLGRTLR